MRSSHAAALSLALLVSLPERALAGVWGCHGTKPGHPTPEERIAFVREVGAFAVQAEKKHGVPASALAALSIAESGYGYTRVAIEANNLFAWKFVTAAAEGRKSYLPACHLRRAINDRFIAFKSRGEAFDFVAAKLATLDAYRPYTDAYKAARKGGNVTAAAIDAWLAGVATRYSQKPDEFVKKIRRIMNNPAEPADVLSAELNLYRLSVPPGDVRASQ
jgi:hypothetical protein